MIVHNFYLGNLSGWFNYQVFWERGTCIYFVVWVLGHCILKIWNLFWHIIIWEYTYSNAYLNLGTKMALQLSSIIKDMVNNLVGCQTTVLPCQSQQYWISLNRRSDSEALLVIQLTTPRTNSTGSSHALHIEVKNHLGVNCAWCGQNLMWTKKKEKENTINTLCGKNFIWYAGESKKHDWV